MKPILEIKNVSKKFRIGHEHQSYLSLRDKLANVLRDTRTVEDFWALKDVSFNVMPGDTLGIIGKNGAGKSTLLKILSRITPPTAGKIISRGRIASLLEVGTGFHPELSGRENVFLNGSILGMKRAEIQKQFDAIVDFAGVEKFIDTPLKHYSSGMQLRLAFAVAAFLEPEILVIDEVLAVGDAEFQKKCIGKIEDVSKTEGRTVLFVSHNTASLNKLCKKGILLRSGLVHSSGTIGEVIHEYLKEKITSQLQYTWDDKDSAAVLRSAHLENEKQEKVNTIVFGQKLFLHLTIAFRQEVQQVVLGLAINTQFSVRMLITDKVIEKADKGVLNVKIEVPAHEFCPGYFDFDFSIQDSKKHLLDIQRSFCEFEILKDNTAYEYLNYDYGLITKKIDWKIL